MTGIFLRPPLGTLQTPTWMKPLSQGGRGLLDLLLKRVQVSQSELAVALTLSQPSVARLVGGFVTDDMVRLSARAPTGRGNPSVTLSLNPDYAAALGVGIFGDAVSIAVVDFAGNVRAEQRLPIEDRSVAGISACLQPLAADVIKLAGVEPTRVVGAGVGFSGFLIDRPLRFNPPTQLADWADADLPAVLSDALGLPVIADNDATVGAIAENLLGIGRRCRNFAYCHLTNGFGGGLILDGRVTRGNLANAGDFGGVWWLLDQGYPNLELLRQCVADGGDRFGSVEEMLIDLHPDMPGIKTWLSLAARPFASLIFILGHICAPERVVIGGRIPGWLASRLAARLELPNSPARNDEAFALPEIVAREVEGDSVAIGAAVMVLQQLFFA